MTEGLLVELPAAIYHDRPVESEGVRLESQLAG